ncbi:MAG: hypothetical protein IJK83_02685 [Clostridiales bacterium]|nr:hypothetical protein [Clostridiales bacterium]
MGKRVLSANSKAVVPLILTAALLFSSCTSRSRRNEPVKEVVLINDTWVVEKYMEAVSECDHAIYEQVSFNTGRTDGLGPHEYRFRGIVYLTDEEAQSLWTGYEWEETVAPDFEFDMVDIEAVGSGPWYRCHDFEKDNYSTIVSNYTVFDGEKIVFDIHQI